MELVPPNSEKMTTLSVNKKNFILGLYNKQKAAIVRVSDFDVEEEENSTPLHKSMFCEGPIIKPASFTFSKQPSYLPAAIRISGSRPV